mmetsp:Transcript_29544/g.91925  ORF Transcript_29544/g.91925 Transcript_29544/m.91925 type:complete len:452 (-) Transcript_29544:234-1589(-)
MVDVHKGRSHMLVALQGSLPTAFLEEAGAHFFPPSAMRHSVCLLPAVAQVQLLELKQLEVEDHCSARTRLQAELAVAAHCRVGATNLADLSALHREHRLVHSRTEPAGGGLKSDLPFLDEHGTAYVLACFQPQRNLSALCRPLVATALRCHLLCHATAAKEGDVLQGHDVEDLQVVLQRCAGRKAELRQAAAEGKLRGHVHQAALACAEVREHAQAGRPRDPVLGAATARALLHAHRDLPGFAARGAGQGRLGLERGARLCGAQAACTAKDRLPGALHSQQQAPGSRSRGPPCPRDHGAAEVPEERAPEVPQLPGRGCRGPLLGRLCQQHAHVLRGPGRGLGLLALSRAPGEAQPELRAGSGRCPSGALLDARAEQPAVSEDVLGALHPQQLQRQGWGALDPLGPHRRTLPASHGPNTTLHVQVGHDMGLAGTDNPCARLATGCSLALLNL